MILFIPIIGAWVLVWFIYAFPYLLAFAATVAEWCQSLFLQCLEYVLIIKISFLWVGFIVVAAAFLYVVSKAVFVLIKTHRQIKNLPVAGYGDVIVIKDDKLKTAFTHGLFNPKIYISTGLINTLDTSELQAVYLHEMHHKKHKDPLRLLILSIIRDTFSYIPISNFFKSLIHSKTEAKADDAVVAAMKEPISLAGALLKVAGFNKNVVMAQPASISGFGSIEGRIRRLVEGADEKVQPPGIKTIIASICITGFLVLSLSLPLFASFPAPGRCDTSHCAVHMNKLGKDCQSHCELSKHVH